jgi:hypothetical protein
MMCLPLAVETLQQREDHWVIADLVGKGGHVRTPQVGLGSSNVLQPIALTGDLSVHGVGCQIDLTGPRNRTVINEHLTEELLIP